MTEPSAEPVQPETNSAGQSHVGRLAADQGMPAPQSRRLRWAPFIALVILAGLLALRIADVDPLARMRLLGFDFMQRMVPVRPLTAPSDVVIIDIDDASISALGQWPWPRSVMADTVDMLNQHNVRLIAFDVLFAEPDRMMANGEGGGNQDEAVPARPSGSAATDAAFARAIAESSAPVVLATALQGVGISSTVDRPILPPTIATAGASPLNWLPQADGVIGNIAILEDAADGRGFLTTISDGDGVVRRLPLVAHVGANLQSGLVLEIVRLALGADTVTVTTHPQFGIRSATIGDWEIGTDESGSLWLPTPPARPVDHVSIADLLNGAIDEDALSGSIVLVGSTATGLGDRLTVSTGSVRSGVDVLADGLLGALTDRTVARPGYLKWLEVLLALMVGLILVYRMALYTAVRTAIWGGIFIAVIAGAAFVLLAFANILADPTFPILTAAVVAAIVGYCRSRDVEQSRTEALLSLAEAAAFTHRLIDATFDSVIAVDRNGRLLFANRAARALPVFASELDLGTDVMSRLQRTAATVPEDGPSLVAAMTAAHGPVDLRGPGDAPMLVEASATELEGDPGGTVVLVMRDVTARRASQHRIEAQARELEAMAAGLQSQTEVAQRARTAAEQASSAKDEFLMMMSHELRTPLNAVIGFTELMASEPYGPLGERYQAYLKDIRGSGAQLLAMIDAILEVIRLDRDDVMTDDGTFDLERVIDECCAAMRAEAGAKSVNLAMRLADSPPHFFGDPVLMRHVLVSLLSNAIKFTEQGGRVTVSVEAETGHGVTIIVSDTGIGMTKTELERAVLLLEHGGGSTARTHSGAGVGLALAKLATEKQGGQVKLSSTVGVGTTVEIWYPESRVRRVPPDEAGEAAGPVADETVRRARVQS